MSGKYDDLSRERLIELLEKRDRERKLGLVWERDEIAADKAIDHDFVVARIDAALSDKPAPWDNLIIEGDNYDALRWLRMTHRGRVKCIYIDPPYNTGNKDWVYNDRYMSADDRFRQSTWLEFLFRRLTLARDLLSDDGVILVSINDDQRALLELMMDQALPGMRLGSLPWRTRQGSNADQGSFLSVDHEHILVYGNEGFRFSGTEKSFAHYSNPDNHPDGDWTKDNLTLGFDRHERPNLFYPIHDPKTDTWYPPNPDRVWVYASRKNLKPGQRLQTAPIEQMIEEDRIWFPDDQRVEVWETLEELHAAIDAREVPMRSGTPLITKELPDLEFWVGKRVAFGAARFKRFKKDLRNPTQPLSSWIVTNSDAPTVAEDENTIISGTNDEGSKAVRSVFGSKAFNYAKPVSLIRELVRQSTAPSDIVLDFFAGSATTAQAVMELNAEDGGDRRFVMVSSTEATEDERGKNLCRDVTAERVRRLNASDDKKYADLAAGFAYLTTHQIDFEDIDYDLEPADAWAALEAFHGLPLTLYDADQPWNIHEGEDATLVLVDRFEPALLDWLRPRQMQNIHVYAWAPGQITTAMDGMHIHVAPVRETLVRAFRA
ncbi:MAG: site-specific DNA-methyltransferase [Pseudomonadota bacterium]